MNPLNLFRKSQRPDALAQAHMTWATSTVGRTVTRTGAFLKKQIWIWPIFAVVFLSVIGFTVRRAIETTMKENLQSELQTLLNVEAAMLETWFKEKSSNAETMVNDFHVRETIYGMLGEKLPAGGSKRPSSPADLHTQLQSELAPAMSSHDYVGYFVADKSKQIVSASFPALVGQKEIAEYDGFLTRALEGETIVSPPFPSVVMMKNKLGQTRMGEPTMYVCAPVRDVNFQVVAALALQIRPEREFTRILQLGRIGESGETYAFDKTGRMISNSRFDDSLILLGLLPDRENSHSILNLLVRDPQGNVAEGYRPTKRRSELPLTQMAADAIAGNSGVDVNGYRDYRGVPVVGAWTWLSKYEIGLTTEVDLAEAFRPLTILQRTFWALLALLILSSIAIFVFTVIVAKLQLDARRAAVEAQQLGQYTLETKLGSGAMGTVYKAHHGMLRRATAVKMLDVDKVNDASIERFEREVQMTCQLNHPNTVAIYDYGRTPEDVFYYAMEFLDGIDLQTLCDTYGPQPEQRVIHILLQVCGSLYEAHSMGLVHRDIKPANIMLNRRGCEPDVVKVLDFGLVKAIDEQKQSSLTAATALTGTPLYMSPEAIQTPASIDTRSDLYAVGAVGYFLVTGRPVFEAESIVELYQQHVKQPPVPPSERLGKEVSREFENALMACLDKSRARRPQTARDLAQLLRQCPTAGNWTAEEADAWWGRHERSQLGFTKSATGKSNSGVMERTILGGPEGETESS